MTLSITQLPSKQSLVYLDMQIFSNPRKRGLATDVIKVQYRVKNRAIQSFVIPITSVTREINRRSKNVMGSLDGGVIKQQAQELTKSGVQPFFGFRQVMKVERVPGKHGGSWAKWSKKSDASTYCWAVSNVENQCLDVTLKWGDDSLQVSISKKRQFENPKASQGIGYWNSRLDLAQYLNLPINQMAESFDPLDSLPTVVDIQQEKPKRSNKPPVTTNPHIHILESMIIQPHQQTAAPTSPALVGDNPSSLPSSHRPDASSMIFAVGGKGKFTHDSETQGKFQSVDNPIQDVLKSRTQLSCVFSQELPSIAPGLGKKIQL